ncbi:hypothetical protein QYM36_000595 [Artemia franciscana]|uniref:RRM domain-containing protein n=1 Tax=Artemia franciscana TaxID=6661 RepID=A0AA88LGP4_ARTSF|nr:hypothetical protein QYM36_000595 [Artemia franciscana]
MKVNPRKLEPSLSKKSDKPKINVTNVTEKKKKRQIRKRHLKSNNEPKSILAFSRSACLWIQGLDLRINNDHLFNVFSIYGYVKRVIIVEDCGEAVVEMAHEQGARNAATSLNGMQFFSKSLEISIMNNQHLFMDSFSDHHRWKEKTFTSSIFRKWSRQNVVTDTIFIHSVPDFLEEPMIREVFKFKNLPQPNYINFYSSTNTGSIRVKSEKEALEAIAILNNIPLFVDTTDGIFRLKLDFKFNRQAKNLNNLNHVLSNLRLD